MSNVAFASIYEAIKNVPRYIEAFKPTPVIPTKANSALTKLLTNN